jgi:hypothetical protein
MHNVSDIGIVNTIMMCRSAIVMAKSNPTKLVHVPRDLVACDGIGSWRVTHWQGEPKTPGRSTAQRGALSRVVCDSSPAFNKQPATTPISFVHNC